VPQIEVDTHKVAAPDVVVPTLDTVRHESLLYTWLAEHKPLGTVAYECMREDGQCTYNVTARHVRTTIVAVEKQ
jgi:hypothetical protein